MLPEHCHTIKLLILICVGHIQMLNRKAPQTHLNECKPTTVCSIGGREAKGLVEVLGGGRNSSGKVLEKCAEK